MTEDATALLPGRTPAPAGAVRPRPADAAPPDGTPATRWTAEVRRDDGALDELAAEWDALAARCRTATSFQSAAWLASWWRAYGRPGRLRLLLVRRDGRLVAAAALTVRRTPYRVLVPVGAGVSDYNDVLLDDACADRAAAELAAALRARFPRTVTDLRELRPDGAAQRLPAHWPGRVRRLPDSVCQHLPALPMEELLRRLPGRTAQRNRVKQRRIAEAGVEVREVPADGAPAAVDAMLRLHELQWRGRGATPEHLGERFGGHLREAVRGMVAAGRASVQEYRLDGELVAVNLLLLSPAVAGLYMYGAHPSLRQRLDIAGLLFGESLARTLRDGVPVLSLLRGTEPYKQRWRPDLDRNERLVLGGRLAPAAALHAGAVRLRCAAARAARTRLPWLEALRTRLRELRAPRRGDGTAQGRGPGEASGGAAADAPGRADSSSR
ncbi:GNAT family N-acetyltransferase [Streptacidiphilus sp. ASG 303]|uniref:GNAT family N-acetyltransferase n=1 Tax=Streptacidiphilus sp. ASG 303 TaxID=2896847 RepID=UPI001E4057C2|nr:GNAT family N-acetyltransferase [Streptacidiphilus sp. ASG 303]MCD0483218.1 GNAT family N-acetyltransferase [Streptacidiphilus sp. ASG 303]